MSKINKSVAAGLTRRAFAGRAVVGTCVIAIVPAAAWAAVHAEESDETSVALGYKHDTKNVDKKKYPKHDVSQRCVNCAMWQGAAADPWAGCAMFGRKHIAAQGWCLAWAKKPG
ncbi:high-potential iron-sulfur protein [Variovorax sp. EBFNA2]|uniref:high-potential iron-sulfur protein n=1 Tax=Variovorax sp. EBFNA2 TaxID=3342097 RepID=UPI0029C09809|nr:high-potential iron-sulfur protein [Variovorax boronicumulans]WPG41282.1 high-potential iron-sulfur protein [Variovorax boronicumulans]